MNHIWLLSKRSRDSVLAYLPALACEGLLIIIGWEPQALPPFPYTWPWGCLLLGVILVGFLLVWLHAHFISWPSLSPIGPNSSWARRFIVQKITLRVIQRLGTYFPLNNRLLKRLNIAAWLRVHWGLLVIVAIACVLSCYGLSYEPYWQDELTSYYAAKGVLAHGIPTLLSGFIYTKGELYS